MRYSGKIVGWHHLPFGKHVEDVEDLAVQAVQGALRHAGIAADEVDAIYAGQFNEGFSPQGFPASLALQADEQLRFTPATRVENACANGSAAVQQGLQAIESGSARTVLVVGFEKMSGVSVAFSSTEPATTVPAKFASAPGAKIIPTVNAAAIAMMVLIR